MTSDMWGRVGSASKLIHLLKETGFEWRKKIDQSAVQGSEC